MVHNDIKLNIIQQDNNKSSNLKLNIIKEDNIKLNIIKENLTKPSDNHKLNVIKSSNLKVFPNLNIVKTTNLTGSTQVPLETLSTQIVPSGLLNCVKLNIMPVPLGSELNVDSDHCCYILKSKNYNRIYIGYTVNFSRRLRKHNGELSGGADKTKEYRPWIPICIIRGFNEYSSVLRFEYRLQKATNRLRKDRSLVNKVINKLSELIIAGDGSHVKKSVIPWPKFNIYWYNVNFKLLHPNINNYKIFNVTLINDLMYTTDNIIHL